MFARAKRLLSDFKGDNYTFGTGVWRQVVPYAVAFGKRIMVISNLGHAKEFTEAIVQGLEQADLALAGDRVFPGARPNAPREDVYRIATYLLHFKPDCIVVIGGGSSIDAVKAANVLATLGTNSPEVDSYFGTGLVSEALAESKNRLIPLVAVPTAASSGSHLTKYSNVTEPISGQKKLIVDEAIIPDRAVFDYETTVNMPPELTTDGALDGMAHCLEVFYNIDEAHFDLMSGITEVALNLILEHLPVALENPRNLEAREALGLATDLGGYAIMLGGTNGAHLTSFSFVDLASHGRACGLMNPYYTVFFAPAIEKQLKTIGDVFAKHSYIQKPIANLAGRELGEAVAAGMIVFSKSVNAPTKLKELRGFSDAHIERALTAAKDPQLEMKLKNMPVPLGSQSVDDYMALILQAAIDGDFRLIKSMPD